MSDLPSTTELRRIRNLLIWLIFVVTAAALYLTPNGYSGTYDSLIAPSFLVVASSFDLAGILTFVLIYTAVDTDASGA